MRFNLKFVAVAALSVNLTLVQAAQAGNDGIVAAGVFGAVLGAMIAGAAKANRAQAQQPKRRVAKPKKPIKNNFASTQQNAPAPAVATSLTVQNSSLTQSQVSSGPAPVPDALK